MVNLKGCQHTMNEKGMKLGPSCMEVRVIGKGRLENVGCYSNQNTLHVYKTVKKINLSYKRI